MKKFKKILVANRGEIAIRIFRACNELGINTVAIYSKEDATALHRYKADESYLIGENKDAISAYLDIDSIIEVAKMTGADAIHPGYGFLSENLLFAQRCQQEGIKFIGPDLKHLDMFGDKVKARTTAIEAGLPVIPGTKDAVDNFEELENFTKQYGYPVIIKAISGGGGRGMRIVWKADELREAYERASSEALKAFGNGEVYIERYINRPKHIEVQIIGDEHGNIVHLYERDCSVQRRHQKVVEIAPSISLPEELRRNICQAAVKLSQHIGYINAGTVEFLVADNEFYFIEVNPRIQVEHTVTEMITGIDLVQSQILVAEGYDLHSPEMGIPQQQDIKTHGYAIQCRVTTEDPQNNFLPDTGKIMTYRSGGGFGIRLDAGEAYAGANISPYYDSLLVKVTTYALTFKQAAQKMSRTLQEFRIRGIKTNIPFLQNVVVHPNFLTGNYDTSFIDITPELFVFKKSKDRGTKLLNYIANVSVNGFPGIADKSKPKFDLPIKPSITEPLLPGTKQLLDQQGPKAVAKWVTSQSEVLITDTTMRDAHQSLLATRVRSKDILAIAPETAAILHDAFSLEVWGGATFDVAYNFLKESPWERLTKLREAMPNVMLQMLFRASNAVGYKNYPDNIVQEFVKQSALAGVDVFRIFDSLNWLESMKVAIEAVQQSGKFIEGSICYTGDILNTSTTNKYNLAYYVNLAKELQAQGIHSLAIKDMGGLLKPEAAYQLVGELKSVIDIPLHLHTHDTSGNGISTLKRAIDAGVDIVDTAVNAMSGHTAQPSGAALFYALQGSQKQLRLNVEGYEALSQYWAGVRQYYQDFNSDTFGPNTSVYRHEMPGGQYSNLQQQAKSLGLGHRWSEVEDMYRRVNQLFGDIIKVTPSSKVVGDMALYMVQNNLDEQSVIDKGMYLDFPESVISFFRGDIGQPYGGFPKELQKIVLKNIQPYTERPGEKLAPINLDELKVELQAKLQRDNITPQEVISYALYPKVYSQYKDTVQIYSNVDVLDTPTFFYGMQKDELIKVEIEQGKILMIKLIAISEPNDLGQRLVTFELNGQSRELLVKDETIIVNQAVSRQADSHNPNHIAAQMPGTITKINVNVGDPIKQGQHLIITEAMKMETTIQAPFDGIIEEIVVTQNQAVQAGDLLIIIKSN